MKPVMPLVIKHANGHDWVKLWGGIDESTLGKIITFEQQSSSASDAALASSCSSTRAVIWPETPSLHQYRALILCYSHVQPARCAGSGLSMFASIARRERPNVKFYNSSIRFSFF